MNENQIQEKFFNIKKSNVQNVKSYSSLFRSRKNSSQNKQSTESLSEKKDTQLNENQIKNNQTLLNQDSLYTSYSKFHEMKLISVGLASGEKIRQWAEKTLPNGKVLGQVNTANTLHHKTFKPQKGGLFCERIFGPLKDFECACGQTQRPNDSEYQKILQHQQTERKFCPNCDVEYTWSIIRRYQMGYIQLVSPVSHLWYLKANPSYLSLLLDMKRKNLENIIYCSETMTLENTWKSTQSFGMSLGAECSPTVLFSAWQQLLIEEQAFRAKTHEKINHESKNNSYPQNQVEQSLNNNSPKNNNEITTKFNLQKRSFLKTQRFILPEVKATTQKLQDNWKKTRFFDSVDTKNSFANMSDIHDIKAPNDRDFGTMQSILLSYKQKEQFPKKHMRNEDIGSDNSILSKTNDTSLNTFYLFLKKTVSCKNDFKNENFSLTLQKIWKKFYMIVYRSAQLKSSTILQKINIKVKNKIKNQKESSLTDEFIFLQQIRNSKSSMKSVFLEGRSDKPSNKIELLKLYLDTETKDISKVSLWSLVSFFDKIELVGLKSIPNKKNLSLINLIQNHDQFSAFFTNNISTNSNITFPLKIHFEQTKIQQKKSPTVKSKNKKHLSLQKKSTNLKTLIQIIKYCFRLQLTYCVQNSRDFNINGFQTNLENKTFSFMNSICNQWLKNTKGLINLLVNQISVFLIKRQLQKKIKMKFVISNNFNSIHNNLYNEPKVYCLQKNTLCHEYLVRFVPYYKLNGYKKTNKFGLFDVKKTTMLSTLEAFYNSNDFLLNHTTRKQFQGELLRDLSVSEALFDRNLNETIVFHIMKGYLNTSYLVNKQMFFQKLLHLLKKTHINEIVKTTKPKKHKTNPNLLNQNAFDSIQKTFLIRQNTTINNSDCGVRPSNQLRTQFYKQNKITILSNQLVHKNFLLKYGGYLSKLKTSWRDKLQNESKTLIFKKNAREICYTHAPFLTNVSNRIEQKHFKSIFLTNKKNSLKPQTFTTGNIIVSKNGKTRVELDKKIEEIFSPATSLNASINRVTKLKTSHKKSISHKSVITACNNAMKHEFLKNRIFNNVYCLSHRYCWNLERNWQYFSYYNSAQGNFDDFIIPCYKHRLISTITSHDVSIENTIAGAAIIQKLLLELNPKELRKMDKQNRILLYELNKKISKLKNLVKKGFAEKIEKKQLKQFCERRDQLIRRTKLVRKLFRKNSNPESMILTSLPVLPPDLRPILKMQDQIAASDLNRLYQRVIYRNDRLKKFLKDPAISNSFEMKYAQRLLQEAVDNLIQNGKSGVTPERDSRGRALKSLSEVLKGKQGRFRQYLLGKRVDYSGRSVIVVGPKLKLHECGLPKEMAKELFLPFLIKRILHYKLARTVIGAKMIIKINEVLTEQLLQEILQSHPILLNRAPTLHRLGIQAFQPRLVEGRAILLHPLVCPAFNADFDGDQMAVHVPITVEARSEAWKLMFSRNNLISPATGDPIMLPSQDMVLGCYYLTTEIPNAWISQNQSLLNKTNNIETPAAIANYEKISPFDKSMLSFCFSNFDQVMIAYQQKQIDVHTSIWVVWNNSLEIANEISQPLEIRLNLQGYWHEIRSKSFRRFDCTGFKLNQLIRTTAGRVLLNTIIYNCIRQK
uniref:DNA-directed RNA polymerase subunit beta' n=1 Tax=Bracteacoccus aerius TaxID=50041 RepID=A0A140HAN8_9CHLO|nr:beta subunit of RNA polymerase [Bracteacoccus aerius]AMO01237.1 beta subunit of RNA polymerase [Bracteacoccus aerius]